MSAGSVLPASERTTGLLPCGEHLLAPADLHRLRAQARLLDEDLRQVARVAWSGRSCRRSPSRCRAAASQSTSVPSATVATVMWCCASSLQQRRVVVRLADAVGHQDDVAVRRRAREDLVAGPPAARGRCRCRRRPAGRRCARARACSRAPGVTRCIGSSTCGTMSKSTMPSSSWCVADELRRLARRALRHRDLAARRPAVSDMLPERSSTSSIARLRRCRSPGTRLATGSTLVERGCARSRRASRRGGRRA